MDYILAPVNEIKDWEFYLDNNTSRVYLISYINKESEECIIYDYYTINGKEYKTYLQNSCLWMFYNKYNLKSIKFSKNLDTSNVLDMCNMFKGCRSLTHLDLAMFNTSNVINMQGMFYECYQLVDINLASFDTSKVKNMSFMFAFCENLKYLNLSHFNTCSVTDMSRMFYACESLELVDISSFNTGNVDNMTDMFCYCTKLASLNLLPFDIWNIKHMERMFKGCNNLNIILANVDTWIINNNCYREDMFKDCKCKEVCLVKCIEINKN